MAYSVNGMFSPKTYDFEFLKLALGLVLATYPKTHTE